MSKKPITLGYLSQSVPNVNSRQVAISVDRPQNSSAMPPAPVADVVGSGVTPAIIYTGWRNDFYCTMGRSQIKDDPSDFVYNAFLTEAKRSASFGIDSTSDLRLQMDIQALEVKGPYRNTGFFFYLFFFAVWGTTDFMGPSAATCSIKYTLMSGERKLTEKVITTRSALDPLQLHEQMDPTLLRGTYSVVMGEQLSDAVRMNIEQGINATEGGLQAL